jgi:hypothetical protein
MVDDVVVQGALAAAAGLGTAVAGIYFIEKKAAEGGDKLSETQYTKIAGSMDGSDAENKFSGSDQTLDDLIAAMEAAQVILSSSCARACRFNRLLCACTDQIQKMKTRLMLKNETSSDRPLTNNHIHAHSNTYSKSKQ